MKHILLALVLLAAACGKDDQSCPGKTIAAISPDNNPVNYEVVINTAGFSDQAVVRFGQSAAASRAGGESNQIIARVPAGLSGNVQVTVEEGDCLARYDDFRVLGAFPADVQGSLTNIVIPPAGTPSLTGFQNVWRNAADTTMGFNLQPDPDDPKAIHPQESVELLDDFAITNPISGTVDLATNDVYIRVDRTARGGDIEEFDGAFILPPAGFPDLPVRPYYLLLTSRTTGRQVLLMPPA